MQGGIPCPQAPGAVAAVLWTVLFVKSWIFDLVNFVVVVVVVVVAVVFVVHMQKNLQFQFYLVYIIAVVMIKCLLLRSN